MLALNEFLWFFYDEQLTTPKKTHIHKYTHTHKHTHRHTNTSSINGYDKVEHI